MKKIFSIAMLLLLLFNMGGHVLLFQYLDPKAGIFANYDINSSLSKSFKLIELNDHSQTVAKEIEEGFDLDPGEVEVNGRNYNDVAIKITVDTVYLKYTSHYEAPRLVDELSLKEMGDNPLQKKNHQLEKKTGIDNEYNFTIHFLHTEINESVLVRSFVYITPKLTNTYLSTLGQPPDLA